MTAEYSIIVSNPPTEEQIRNLCHDGGHDAVVSLIVERIQRGLKNDAWVIVGNKAIPITVLQADESCGMIEVSLPVAAAETEEMAP